MVDLTGSMSRFSSFLQSSKFTQGVVSEMVSVDKSDWAFNSYTGFSLKRSNRNLDEEVSDDSSKSSSDEDDMENRQSSSSQISSKSNPEHLLNDSSVKRGKAKCRKNSFMSAQSPNNRENSNSYYSTNVVSPRNIP